VSGKRGREKLTGGRGLAVGSISMVGRASWGVSYQETSRCKEKEASSIAFV